MDSLIGEVKLPSINIIRDKNFVAILIVNENFGFGVLDALKLVKNAKKWNVTVSDQVICTMNVTKRYVFPSYAVLCFLIHLL